MFDMARCKMITANVGRYHWAEAAHAAKYCLNRAPTSSLEGVTPYVEWHGKAPKLEPLRSFGCTTLVSFDPHQRRKPEDTG